LNFFAFWLKSLLSVNTTVLASSVTHYFTLRTKLQITEIQRSTSDKMSDSPGLNEKGFDHVASAPLADDQVETLKDGGDISDDELLNTIGYKQVSL
jgi:predicted NAD/FAD-binding protein